MEDRAVGPYVGEALAQLLEHPRADGYHASRNFHLKEAPDDGEETDSVQEEAGPDSKPCDEQSRRGSTEHPRAVEHHQVEPKRVGGIFLIYHLDHKRLAPAH